MKQRRKKHMLVRFWNQVDIQEPHSCWNWKGSKRGNNGYGEFRLVHNRGLAEYHQKVYAHVFAYSLAHSGIPEGMMVLHECDNRYCVNPAHLYAGNGTNNNLDCYRRNRRQTYKLPVEIVREIRARVGSGEVSMSVAKSLNLSNSTIYKISHFQRRVSVI